MDFARLKSVRNHCGRFFLLYKFCSHLDFFLHLSISAPHFFATTDPSSQCGFFPSFWFFLMFYLPHLKLACTACCLWSLSSVLSCELAMLFVEFWVGFRPFYQKIKYSSLSTGRNRLCFSMRWYFLEFLAVQATVAVEYFFIRLFCWSDFSLKSKTAATVERLNRTGDFEWCTGIRWLWLWTGFAVTWFGNLGFIVDSVWFIFP
jgi:hypothetical protein